MGGRRHQWRRTPVDNDGCKWNVRISKVLHMGGGVRVFRGIHGVDGSSGLDRHAGEGTVAQGATTGREN